MLGRRELMKFLGLGSAVAASGAGSAVGAILSETPEPFPLPPAASPDDWLDKENGYGVLNRDALDAESILELIKDRRYISMTQMMPPKYTSKKSWSETYKHSEWRKEMEHLQVLERRLSRDKEFTEKLLRLAGMRAG